MQDEQDFPAASLMQMLAKITSIGLKMPKPALTLTRWHRHHPNIQDLIPADHLDACTPPRVSGYFWLGVLFCFVFKYLSANLRLPGETFGSTSFLSNQADPTRMGDKALFFFPIYFKSTTIVPVPKHSDMPHQLKATKHSARPSLLLNSHQHTYRKAAC